MQASLRGRMVVLVTMVLVVIVAVGCGAWTRLNAPFSNGGLIPKSVDDAALPANPQLAAAVKQGAAIFANTPANAPRYAGPAMSCTNCHIDNGQAYRGFPVAGVAAVYPTYDSRSNVLVDLAGRVTSCFVRSLNGSAPPANAPELLAVVAYLAWLSEGQPVGQSPAWRDGGQIQPIDRIAIDKLDPKAGEQLFLQKCAECHGSSGQGQSASGALPAAPALWGDRSFNDGAGLGQVYTLATFIKNKMPANAPGSINLTEAQNLAAYLDSQPRPVFAGKAQDYIGGVVPVDAVYYPQRYPNNPLSGRPNR
ncbi:MAG: c-type cytochrome [Dehalococcoidia bacterium]